MLNEYFLRTLQPGYFMASEIWVAVAYLAGMFLVLTFRP